MLGALLLGVLGATRRDTFLDNGVKFIAILGQALPGFWVAIVAVFLFSVTWQILPTSGMGGVDHYILPVFTLAFFLLPGMMRLVRSSMLDVLDSEYIKLARIKGLPERII
ncbi:MAG: ABC transporter permease subunit, partial [Gammaproteobacteria bacterium]|nr:ABC transporter permease subunit [Gammaproteobacteria bacterium]